MIQILLKALNIYLAKVRRKYRALSYFRKKVYNIKNSPIIQRRSRLLVHDMLRGWRGRHDMLLRHVRRRNSRRHLRALLHRDRRGRRDRSTRAARWLRPVLDVDVVRGGNHGVRRMWSTHRVVHLTLGLWHRVGNRSFCS